MKVKVLNPTYLMNLRDSAVAEYKKTLSSRTQIQRDLVAAKEALLVELNRREILNGNDMLLHLERLRILNEEKDQAKKSYEEALKAEQEEIFYGVPEFSWFVSRYEEQHYHPQEEDYHEIEVYDVRESHASQSEAVGGMIIGEN